MSIVLISVWAFATIVCLIALVVYAVWYLRTEPLRVRDLLLISSTFLACFIPVMNVILAIVALVDFFENILPKVGSWWKVFWDKPIWDRQIIKPWGEKK